MQNTSSLAGETRSQNQHEFSFALNSSISAQPASSVVSKRSPGRPRGPRGFVFFVRFRGATEALKAAVRWLTNARSMGFQAGTMRRLNGPQCSVARMFAFQGRNFVVFALACFFAAFNYVQGGAL